MVSLQKISYSFLLLKSVLAEYFTSIACHLHFVKLNIMIFIHTFLLHRNSNDLPDDRIDKYLGGHLTSTVI